MKKFTPFVLVIVVLVLALAALGVGYGYWTETLDINGTVTTGTLDVDLTNLGGTCPSTLTSSSLIDVAIVNAYPGYSCTVTFDVKNMGNIAADFASSVATPASPGTLTFDTSACSADNLAVSDSTSCTATYSLATTLNETTLPEGDLSADSFSIHIAATQFNAP